MSLQSPLPLAFLEEWRKRLGNGWVDLILDEAAQHLKSHVKLLLRWEKDEAKRKADLDEFCKSELGKKYLEARSKYFPDGIPRNRSERLKIYSNPELVKWQKSDTALRAAAHQEELFENNPELVKLRDVHTKYQRLTKPFTIPAWQPVSERHPRWPFLPAKLFLEGPVWDGNKLEFTLALPDFSANGYTPVITIPVKQTLRLKALKPGLGPWTFQTEDEITGQKISIAVKGVRFQQSGSAWKARVTYEKLGLGLSRHEAEVLKAAFKKQPPPLHSGDMVCVFSIEPRLKSRGDQSRRCGFMRVVGVEDSGQWKILCSGPLQSYSHRQRGRQALRRGRAPFWEQSRGANHGGRPSAHGATKLVSLPQMLHIKRNIEREIRLLRLLRDPERRDEAIERVQAKLAHLQEPNHPAAGRWERILACLQAGNSPGAVLIEPLRERLKKLKQKLSGMKRNYRNALAVEVLRTVHGVRTGNSQLPQAAKFRNLHPNGSVFLVIEYHKGQGQGLLRGKLLNTRLAVLGPAGIYRLISEKAEFMTPPVPVVAISPKGIRKQCPSCGHTHAKNQPGPAFKCGACKHGDFLTSVAVRNLAARFFAAEKTPPPEAP